MSKFKKILDKIGNWFFPIVGMLIIVIAFVYSNGSEKTVLEKNMIIQTGTTIALALLTLGYLLATSKAVKSAMIQAEAASEMLNQAKKSRVHSIMPVVCMRYFWGEDNVQAKSVSTWLINIGAGTACNIKVYWNLLEMETELGQGVIVDQTTKYLHPTPLNEKAFGYPLMTDNGSENLRICFHKSETGSQFLTPLMLRQFKAIITYQDIERNNYYTKIEGQLHIHETGKLDLIKENVYNT